MDSLYNPTIVASNLRYLMRRERVTCAMLAEWSGISIRTVHNYRNPNSNERSLETLLKMANTLRTSLDWLMEEHGNVGND